MNLKRPTTRRTKESDDEKHSSHEGSNLDARTKVPTHTERIMEGSFVRSSS